jgi:hypothetical protein
LEQLKVYLAQGGTLVVTACCGRKAFDDSFGPMIERMYGPGALVPVDADDPVITGRFLIGGATVETAVTSPMGSDLRRPRLRRSRGGRFVPPTSHRSTAGGPISGAHRGRRASASARPQIPLLKGVRLPRPGGDGSGTSRWAVIYSPIDIHCGCDGHFCVDCNGYDPRDARAIAANIILSAHLQQPHKASSDLPDERTSAP